MSPQDGTPWSYRFISGMVPPCWLVPPTYTVIPFGRSCNANSKSTWPPGRTLAHLAGARSLGLDGSAQSSQAGRAERVPNPLPPSLPVHKPRLAQDPEVVRDCRLALAERLYEVAYTYLALGGGCTHGQDPAPDRVAEGGKAFSKLIGVGRLERRPEQRRTARFCLREWKDCGRLAHRSVSH